MGNPAPSGSYLLSAQAVVNGKNTQVPVQTMVSIVGANTLTDGTVSLQLDGGKTVLLKDVQRVGM
jgi:flagellar basal-body rod modification protein FlgD